MILVIFKTVQVVVAYLLQKYLILHVFWHLVYIYFYSQKPLHLFIQSPSKDHLNCK